MAFCVRVDKHGNEMERVQLSSRSVRSNCSRSSSTGFSTSTESETLKDLSSRSNMKSNVSSSSYTVTSTIRNYPSQFSMSSDSSSREEQSSEFDDLTGTEGRTYCDTNSWTESTADSATGSATGTYDVSQSSGRPSDIVPPLDLESGTHSGTYLRKLDSIHLGESQQNAAYESWLSAKIKFQRTKQATNRKVREEQERLQQERARLSKERYEKWLQEKASCGAPRKKDKCVIPKEEVCKPGKDLHPAEAQRRLLAWEEKKRIAEEKRQQKIREEQQEKRKREEQRKKMSNVAWKNWIAGANKKPKPVPLNQGMATLRGTVSDIFVNPNEWKSILEDG